MAKLTKAQSLALKPLTPKRRAFVLAYVGVSKGSPVDAARRAGYKKPHPEGSQLLRNPTVMEAIRAIASPREDDAVADLAERRAFWTAVQRGEVDDVDDAASLTVRLRASELLAKSAGDFVERREVKHEAAGVVLFGSIAEAERYARGGDDDER